MATEYAAPDHLILADAYNQCSRIARTHYENFTVGSWFLPTALRPHLYAIYAFCRKTDDLGDESDGDRTAALNSWEQRLREHLDGTPSIYDPVLVAVTNTIHQFDIPRILFYKLIEANRMDQGYVRFESYSDLLHYCDHSANPVGRMVLATIGIQDYESQSLSDATCTALQLTNFWQDIGRDFAMDRIYIPKSDMGCFGYSESDLSRGVVNDEFRSLLEYEINRTFVLFDQGIGLINRLNGRIRLDIALFTKGGIGILKAIRERDYDVLGLRPTLSKSKKMWLMIATSCRLAILGKP